MLAYQVVFQKAFITALVTMDDYRQATAESWGIDPDIAREPFVEPSGTSRFNNILGQALGESHRLEIWGGAGDHRQQHHRMDTTIAEGDRGIRDRCSDSTSWAVGESSPPTKLIRQQPNGWRTRWKIVAGEGHLRHPKAS